MPIKYSTLKRYCTDLNGIKTRLLLYECPIFCNYGNHIDCFPHWFPLYKFHRWDRFNGNKLLMNEKRILGTNLYPPFFTCTYDDLYIAQKENMWVSFINLYKVMICSAYFASQLTINEEYILQNSSMGVPMKSEMPNQIRLWT